MQFINYFFASLVSFLGLLVGLWLIGIAREEQKPLEKYFVLSGKIILLLIFAFVSFYYLNDYFTMMALGVFFLFLLFVEYRMKDLQKKSAIAYAVLGILFFLSSKNQNLFIIESSLILLYGLPTASLLYNKKRNNYNVILYNAGFILISNLLFLL